MKPIPVERTPIKLLPVHGRVIIRSFIPSDEVNVRAVLERVQRLDDDAVDREIATVQHDFGKRHHALSVQLLANYGKVRRLIANPERLTEKRKLLIGASFSGEYALESAALFNPSIVPHPDQSGAPEGGLRFIMSLRATGEGHISSIEFRAGTLLADETVQLDPVSRFATRPEPERNPEYHKPSFLLKLREMGHESECIFAALRPLAEAFTLDALHASLHTLRSEPHESNRDFDRALELIEWLAESNYEIHFDPGLAISERIIFPVSLNEVKGIEDARFVRFVDDDGSVVYYATYTAYNGHTILPQLIRTEDFLHFRILTLNGDGVQNKGMALFPRRIGGRYAMLSRQDDQNILIMFSHSPHHWSDPKVILRPEQPWEIMKIGNCGSPIETPAGWLVITHGVGPMREYSIGAALLDLDDPTRVIGRLREPLVSVEPSEREGYVPNVVYSCGALLHGEVLVLPYAISDRATAIATVALADLLHALGAGKRTKQRRNKGSSG